MQQVLLINLLLQTFNSPSVVTIAPEARLSLVAVGLL